MGAATDSLKEIKFDIQRPGIYNLLEIYEGVAGLSREAIEAKFTEVGYGDFKKDLAEKVISFLEPFQKKYQDLVADPKYIDSLLKEGADKAKAIADNKLKEVKNKVGLG